MAQRSPLYTRFLKHGFLLTLSLSIALNFADQVAAQGTTIDDLPTCAAACALTAATAAGCKLTDATCLCAHPDFMSAAFQCAQGACTVEDRGAVSGVLSGLCASLPGTSSASASAASASSSGTQASSSSSTKPSTTGDTTHVTPSPPISAAPSSPTTPTPPSGTTPTTGAGGVGDGGLSNSGSSTVVVVQTVDAPQTTDTDTDPTSAGYALAPAFGFGNLGALLVFLGAGWVAAQVALF